MVDFIGIVLALFIPIIIVLGILILASIRIINQWETGVRFRLGRYLDTLQPGLRFVIPVLDSVQRVDMRILTIDIPRQQVITKDNVPASINGVVYFKVVDAATAIIKVQDYVYAMSQYAQTALRDVAGSMSLDQVLGEREQIGKDIEKIVEAASKDWGIEVTNIKLQDIDMPEDLKRLMSRQASSEREKRATIIKAEGDRMAAENLSKAAETMLKSPGAMQLRTLQTIDGLGPTASNTVVIAVPLELMELVRNLGEATGKKK
ncbi:MAG TPA: slipin family protein [Candidatus Diapherotrites archaeon]|uniref:Slipin family protein n=1 Tax=Candidatus Iainarchaeum sp. TaxID=3101447 RepID=A0A7J4IW97_9ARCH|nr:slipin family protein [Candidatus Diapherotrites archaeon]